MRKLAEEQRGEMESLREKNNRLTLEVNAAAIQMQKGAKQPTFFEKARHFEIHLLISGLVLFLINLLK